MPPRNASDLPDPDDLNLRPPEAAVARFGGDLDRVAARALNGAALPDGARIALAVSGGPDSMAMLALATAARPGRVIAATFDHGLRPQAAEEARMVAAACRALSVPHATLRPERPIAAGNLQHGAREARYAGLLAWAEREGVSALLTAHHADDQAETLLMRLNRASGLAGLAAIRAWRFAGEAMVLRPLLGWRRAELAAVVEATGLPFVVDPSNADPRHDRSRIRRALGGLTDLDAARLARSAAYLADAEEVIACLAESLWNDRWHGPDHGFAIADQPRELRRRLVRRALIDTRRALGIVRPRFADSANVESLLDALEDGRSAVQGGIKVVVTRLGWQFRPAPPRRVH